MVFVGLRKFLQQLKNNQWFWETLYKEVYVLLKMFIAVVHYRHN